MSVKRAAAAAALLLAFFQLAALLPAAGQDDAADSKHTVIELTWDVVQDQVRPVVNLGVLVHFTAAIVLSKNNVASQAVVGSIGGRVFWTSAASDKLGDADRRHSFQVVAKNRLQRVDNFTQNSQIITVSLSGNRCRLSVDNRLKPGFSEYVLPKDPSFSVYLYFSRVETLKTTCNIHQ